MLQHEFTTKFKKDFKKLQKSGANMVRIHAVMSKLIDEIPLATINRDHSLVGDYIGYRECHVSPDWLLIYKIEGNMIVFTRTGSHSELFR